MVSTGFLTVGDEAAAATRQRRTARKLATGRYEFRTWPHGLPPAAAASLPQSWRLVGAERRSDIYRLTGRRPARLVKLRAGNRRELKRRDRDLGPLQHWTHRAYPMFALSRPAVRALARERGLTGLAPDAGLSPEHRVARLRDAGPAVPPMTVRTSRLLFRTGSSRAETCRVVVAGWSRLTLGFEDPAPDCALGALDALRLRHMPDRSFGDVLCRRNTRHGTRAPYTRQTERITS